MTVNRRQSIIIFRRVNLCSFPMDINVTSDTQSIVMNNNWSVFGQCAKDTGSQAIELFLSAFYIMSPYSTVKDNPYDVPEYEVNVSIK